jgi:hypothetical protein
MLVNEYAYTRYVVELVNELQMLWRDIFEKYFPKNVVFMKRVPLS